MTRLFFPLRIVLPILAAAARCFRAQPLTNAQGASEHLRTQVTAAELFYLRHLRTCAASASGSRSTCSATTPDLCTSGLRVVLGCTMSLVKGVLQSMPSPLEIGVCIAVVNVTEGNNYFQIALAVTSLFLAVCDWRVPRVISCH